MEQLEIGMHIWVNVGDGRKLAVIKAFSHTLVGVAYFDYTSDLIGKNEIMRLATPEELVRFKYNEKTIDHFSKKNNAKQL
jgi:hypothetical protein